MAVTSGFTNGVTGQPTWLDNVQCGGNERTLFECMANPVGTHDCTHAQDAGVICEAGKLAAT